MADDPNAVFVYGTLKSDQKRGRSWPRKPTSVLPAWTNGQLYDLGPYPGMIAGPDRVRGEVWNFLAADMPETLRVLDWIEEYQQPGIDNVYIRQVVSCHLEDGAECHAFTYYYAIQGDLHPSRLIRSDSSGFSMWLSENR